MRKRFGRTQSEVRGKTMDKSRLRLADNQTQTPSHLNETILRFGKIFGTKR